MKIRLFVSQSEATVAGNLMNWELEGESFVVGRKEGCPVRLYDASVSAEHFRLSRGRDGWKIEDLGSLTVTRLNGRLLEAGVTVPLRHLDAIQAGVYSILCSLSEEEIDPWKHFRWAAESDFSLPHLEELHAGSKAAIHLLGPTKTVLAGRSSECSLLLDDSAVSRRHAVFTVKKGTVFCRDLSSSNGTWVNGQRIRGEKALNHGDIIQLGRYKLRFVSAGRVSRWDTVSRTMTRLSPYIMFSLLGALAWAVVILVFS